ncbi:MAG: 30S ribosomal protein S17 [Candidatus Saccharimonadales bacterium]
MAKTLVGIVASNKPDKTIIVRTQTSKTHPIYRKKYMVSARFMAHDEKNEAEEGDKVLITETRPVSARKRFALTKVLEKAQVRHIEPEPTKEAKVEKIEKPTAEKPKAETEAK